MLKDDEISVNHRILTDQESKMIMESLVWFIDNSREGTPKVAIVSYVNNLLIHSRSHVKLRLDEDGTIDFV